MKTNKHYLQLRKQLYTLHQQAKVILGTAAYQHKTQAAYQRGKRHNHQSGASPCIDEADGLIGRLHIDDGQDGAKDLLSHHLK